MNAHSSAQLQSTSHFITLRKTVSLLLVFTRNLRTRLEKMPKKICFPLFCYVCIFEYFAFRLKSCGLHFIMRTNKLWTSRLISRRILEIHALSILFSKQKEPWRNPYPYCWICAKNRTVDIIQCLITITWWNFLLNLLKMHEVNAFLNKIAALQR